MQTSNRYYCSLAIVLSRKNYSEADRILTLLTRNYGKLKVIAKGARRIKSRKRGSIEVFSKIKFSSSKNNYLSILSETEIVYLYEPVRKSLAKTSLAFYFVEVCEKISKETQESYVLFDLLDNYLLKLESGSNLRQLKNKFIYDLLTKSGFWPEGTKMDNPDVVLQTILERSINSARVGKKILS